VISFDEALLKVAGIARPLDSERVPLSEAHGRVLAEPVVARISAPPVDASAMDGYAVRDSDLATLPARLPLAGESFAGSGYDGALPEGACVRIFTGAPVPTGAERVIVQEVVRREGDIAIFETPPGSARHIRSAGSDFAVGDTLLAAGNRIGPRAMVAAAGADVNSLTVWRRPRLMVLSTGDELVDPGTAAGTRGCIPESVSYGVAALATEAGAEFVGTRRLRDDLATMEVAAAEALRDADLVVVTGGASVGERDFAKTMFEPAGLDLIFSKVSIKPGKPVWLGRAGKSLVLGLPGNPTSALVTARLFLVPLIYGLTGQDPADALRWRSLPLAEPLEPTGPRETFSRGYGGGSAVHLFGHQDSSAQKVLADAALLVRRPPGDEAVPAGSPVAVLDF
jgi:molybdopterin molybdotransferase